MVLATPEGSWATELVAYAMQVGVVWARLRVVSEVLVDLLIRPGWCVQMSSLLALPCGSSCLTTLWFLISSWS